MSIIVLCNRCGHSPEQCQCREAPIQFPTFDSGQRIDFPSGMRRDVNTGKTRWDLVYSGPMLKRWAELLTRGAVKYGDDNWLHANSEEVLKRFRESAARHFASWMLGEMDEDHAAGVIYNINGAEYVKAKLAAKGPTQ